MMDGKAFGEMIVGVVKDYVSRATDALSSRIEAMEAQIKAIPAGKDGRDGVDGKDGVEGKQGEPGRDGKDGIAGEPGKDGTDGKSFTPEEVRALVDESVTKAMADIPAPKDGAAGRDGVDGKDGTSGKDGINGKDGTDGRHGKDGEVGQKGDPGLDGRDGLEGQPGRDAVQIDVLDGIDPAKKYQRGTYASFRGGIVRAFKATEPLGSGELEKAGWHVVVNGIDSEEEIVSDEGRTLTRTTTYTSGKQMVREIKTATVLDRGVFKVGPVYQAGDSVTWKGSLWIGQKETKDEPGTSDAWRLAVKRGRDGKDGIGKETPPTPRGPVRLQ